MDTPETKRRRLTGAGVVSAALLFLLKSWAGFASGSIAVVSDAMNSLFDIFSYSATYISVKIQNRRPDDNHHYGHRRAEPLAGFLIAIFAGILGTTLLKNALLGLAFTTQPISASTLSSGVLLISIGVKSGLAYLYRQASRADSSPAMYASYVDSRNDAVASAVAMLGLWFGSKVDAVAGASIGLWVLYSGVRIGLENLDYLMGIAPDAEVLGALERAALRVPHVLGMHDLRAHYVGDRVHVEVHIEVDDGLGVRDAHDIGEAVQRNLESVPAVQAAFVHIDPVPRSNKS